MLNRVSSRRGRLIGVFMTAILLLAGGNVPRACAQVAPGDTVPSRRYFTLFPLYTDGDYRAALTAFASETRSGIKIPGSSWIDSICYLTMTGECYYQMGQLGAALDSYNAALKLFVAYPDWMMRVQFPNGVMPAVAGVVRATPWGQSRRSATVGAFADTYLMGQGRVDNSQAVFQGGVVTQASLFPVHVSEIVRCTTLAMRRRRELLGPICKLDPLTKDVLNVVSRGIGPPNHWSDAWVSVEQGCAYAAMGQVSQANTALQRAITIAGQFDHPLTSTALLELGHLALESGDFQSASNYFSECTYACVNFPNPGNLEEAFRFGLLAHLLLNQKTPYPLLAPAIAWSKPLGFRQLQASLLVSAAENMATLGDSAQAAGLVNNARVVVGRTDLANSQLAARLNHVAAMVAYQTGDVPSGDQAIGAALTFLRTGSVWGFQINLADTRYLNRDFSDREGLLLYDALLRDPTPADWAYRPLECLSVMSTPHPLPLEHWFEAALKNSREHELALEIADRSRRHRFYSTLPMGGRLLSLRWILEGPAELLGERGTLQRQDLLVKYPKYQELAKQAAAIRTALAGKPVIDDNPDARKEQTSQLAKLAEISQGQELILREIAVRREPAEMVFPPLRSTKEIQQNLQDGQVLLAFFSTSRNLYAFLYSHEKYATWHVNSPTALQKQIPLLLREMGNFDQNHELTHNDLTKTTWRATASKIMGLLLEKSTVDLAGNFQEIVIVPDGVLWYLPFEALSIGKGDNEKPLISHARVRYAPTVGLAIPYGRSQKPQPHIGVVVGKMHPQEQEDAGSVAFEEFGRAVSGSVALPRNLPASSSVFRTLLDGLIVFDDIQSADGPYDWSPTQLDKGRPGGALSSWFTLPMGGPEQLMLPGFHTIAESGMRKSNAAGNDLFLSVCGLMSSGVRTILISRWRTGGQTSFDLVREFAQELPHTSPAEAWQRSVQLACDNTLELEHEPRIKKTSSAGEPPKASHPLFWAGYMLVDSGVLPEGQDKALLVPGLNAPARPAGAPAANPGLNQGAPIPAPGAVAPAAAPDDAQPQPKRAKKVKPPPRAPTKKLSSRAKSAPAE